MTTWYYSGTSESSPPTALYRLESQGCLLPNLLRHAWNSPRVTLNFFHVVIAADRVERAESFPDMFFVGGDVGQGVTGVHLEAVGGPAGADFIPQLRLNLDVCFECDHVAILHVFSV